VLYGTKKCDRRLTTSGRNFGVILIGDHEGRVLKYVAKVHGGFMPTVRATVFKRFHGLETKTCPFKNLPEARRGQWGRRTDGRGDGEMQWVQTATGHDDPITSSVPP
jgi:hypothetical protein